MPDSVAEAMLDAGELDEHRVAADVEPRVVDDPQPALDLVARLPRGDEAWRALMGLVSGACLGIAQGLVLARRGDARLAAAWGAAMLTLFALGRVPTTVIGVSAEDQFTVSGAAGAVLFMLASGPVLARSRLPLAMGSREE